MRQAYFKMHIAIFLWGFTAIFGKLISLDEGMLVWYRMLLSSIATAIFLLATKNFKIPNRSELLKLAGIGAVIALHWVTFYGAIKASNVSIAISCFSSVALFTAILEPLSRKQLPKKAELLLSLAVICGIVIIFSVQKLYLKGIFLALISALLASIFTILNKKVSHEMDAGRITFFELGTGWIILTLILPIWFSINGSSFAFPTNEDWGYLLLLSVACTTIAFSLSLQALKKLDAFTMNLSVNLEPLYSIILAIILFNEDKMLNTGFYFGSIIILLSVVLHSIYAIKKKKISAVD
jgi:drug/metabolite transporter (DMT)-like permease